MTGAWILLDSKKQEVNLYTREAVDVIENEAGVQFTRGEWKLFKDEELPPLVEDDPSFQLLNKVGKHLVNFTNSDCLKEIMISQNLPH